MADDNSQIESSRAEERQPTALLRWPSPFSIVFLSFFCWAILNSFTAVAEQGSSQPPNYWQEVKSKKSAKESEIEKDGGIQLCLSSHPDKIRELALLSWQNGEVRPAAALITKLWATDTADTTITYNHGFVDDCLLLGGMYQSDGSFPAALRCYNSLLEYESARLKRNDPVITRDYNNLAVTYYLSGNAATSDNQRKDLFDKSRKLFAIANSTVDRHLASHLVRTLKNNESYLVRDAN